MLMMGGKKKLAPTIMGKLKSSPDFVQKLGEGGYVAKEVNGSKPEKDMDHGHMAAAEDLISAVHSKDPRRVHSALMSHYAMTRGHEDEDTAGDEANSMSVDD